MVAIIGWPDDEGRLEELRSLGTPRLLLVADGVAPPDVTDRLEDWIRIPADDADVAARVEGLRSRAAASGPPAVLDGSVVRNGDRFVRLVPIQARLLEMLLARPASVVGRDELMQAGWPDRSAPRNAVDVQMMRLRRRVATVGLRIQSVRGRGYLLVPVAPSTEASLVGQILVS